jgi:hypothetical protein
MILLLGLFEERVRSIRKDKISQENVGPVVGQFEIPAHGSGWMFSSPTYRGIALLVF